MRTWLPTSSGQPSERRHGVASPWPQPSCTGQRHSPSTRCRVARALDAALASVQAGALDQASSLLDMADAGPLDDFQRGRIALERGRAAYLGNILSRDGAPLLLDAGRRLEPFDTALARETYLNALLAAVTAGCDHELHLEICRA